MGIHCYKINISQGSVLGPLLLKSSFLDEDKKIRFMDRIKYLIVIIDAQILFKERLLNAGLKALKEI